MGGETARGAGLPPGAGSERAKRSRRMVPHTAAARAGSVPERSRSCVRARARACAFAFVYVVVLAMYAPLPALLKRHRVVVYAIACRCDTIGFMLPEKGLVIAPRLRSVSDPSSQADRVSAQIHN